MPDDPATDITSIRGVTRLGDLVVDDESGEIVAYPDDIGADRLEWLARQRADCRQQENAWKAAGAFYSKLVGQQMESEELLRYDGTTVSITSTSSGDRRWGDPELLHALELGPRRTRRAILEATTRLDLHVLRDLEAHRRLPKGTAAEITRGELGRRYYQVRAQRRAAPKVEQGLRERQAQREGEDECDD